jgi:transcriptional regulator with XRE-family HTH domain
MSKQETFGKRLQRLRKDRKLNVWQLAHKAGTSTQSIYYYQNDKRVPMTCETWMGIADALFVSVDYLMRGEEHTSCNS